MLELRGLSMSTEPSIRVLIVEDEDDIRNLIVDQFRESGIGAEGLSNGKEVLIKMETFKPDVVLLDQMMPGKSGNEIIRDIRGNSRYADTPIMMVTGLNSEEEKIAALELGADDYVTKPFSMREVIVRAQALVRRAKQAHKSQQKSMTVGELTVDLSAHKVVLRGVEVQLTLTEFKILVELLKQSGQVLTRDRLRERALGNLNVTDRTIDVHMASLRKKLDTMGDSIETVRGVGYRMAL
ncbi:MAG: DNA-binding response regulator [Oligoflexia bacterium]|nr:MAG: DNA-binding response regulator [Oligoflexia bacterium]